MIKLFKEKQEMSWEDYLRILRNYADSTWFTVSWDDHIKKVNKSENMELKPLLRRNKIEIDKKIFSALLNQIIFTDGDITKKEKIRLEELKINQLEKNAVIIKEKKLTRTIVNFQQQSLLFYELIQMAIIDGDLHPNEFKYLCDLSEVLGIETNILNLLIVFNGKLNASSNSTNSSFAYIVNNINKITKSFKDFSNYGNSKGQNLQQDYSLWEDKISQIALKCKKYNCDISIIKELKEHADKLHQVILKLGFFGVTASGKTALMNALIGENLLPEKTIPTTNVAVKVSQASKRRAIVNFDDGNQEIWSGESLLTQLHEATSEELNSKNFKNINEIKLEHPDFIFPPYFEIFDTPGINAMGHDDHKKITTEKVLPQVDIVIYLTTCTNQIKQADRDFINLAKKHISSDQKIIFVITGKGKVKTDKQNSGKSRETKWQEFTSVLRKCLDKEGLREDVSSIVLIDSIWAQLGRLGYIDRWKQSGISNLIEELSSCYSTLQQNWLNLNLRQVIDLLDNKIQSSLKSKLQENKNTLEQTKADVNNRIQTLKKHKSSNSVDIERFGNESKRKKYELSLPGKPVSNSGFDSAIKTIENTSSDIIRKIQNEFYNCQNDFIEQFKELGMKELSRREINFNRQSVKTPSAKTKQVERDSTGFLSSLARFFHVGGKEKIDIFDPDKSYLILKNYYNKLQDAIELIINDCSSILESQFHSVLIKEIEMLEAKQKNLNKESLDTDKSYLAYLDTTIEDLNYQVDFLEKARSIQKSKKMAKDEQFSNRENRFAEGFANINHLPALWNKYDDLSSKRGIIFVGGDREKHITWFNELYQIQIPDEGDRDTPLWFGKASQDFTNYYSSIPYPDDTSFSKYFLSIPESINGTDNFFPHIVDNVLLKTDWVIGIYIDINRIGSGLSDIKKILGHNLVALASMHKVFFWNVDMGYFEGSERLYELITDINDILDKHPYQNIPRFFGESGDMR
ncbi:MAG: dynamin family protein, partial [Desulfamplus sp.]|nr:dynamin family protein [Desulfamplus sp.]